MSETVRVLGLDPGRKFCGFALMEMTGNESTLLQHGLLNLDTQAGKAALRTAMLDAYALAAVGIALEATWFGNKMGHSPLVGAIINRGQSKIHGYVEALSDLLNLPLLDPVPVSAGKRALTGHGRASKEQMIFAAVSKYQCKLSEHTADACGVALAACWRWQLEQLRLSYNRKHGIKGRS